MHPIQISSIMLFLVILILDIIPGWDFNSSEELRCDWR